MTVEGALALARAAGLERLDARALVAHALARPPAWVVAHGEAPLDATAEAVFRSALARRADGVPFAQIAGVREFRGLAFEVTPDVLVPRPETELLVDWALEILPPGPDRAGGLSAGRPDARATSGRFADGAARSGPPTAAAARPGACGVAGDAGAVAGGAARDPLRRKVEVARSQPSSPRLLASTAGPARVIDLGTGSGAIAVALAAAAAARGTPIEAVAVDASAAALAVARRNAARHGVRLDARLGDWWAPVAGERFDLAVANPPYIAEGDPHLPALRHEPTSALVGGSDGLRDLAAIVAGAAAPLVPGAWLLLEHGHDQAEAVRALLRQAGFTAVETRRDLAGHPRATGGRRPDRP